MIWQQHGNLYINLHMDHTEGKEGMKQYRRLLFVSVGQMSMILLVPGKKRESSSRSVVASAAWKEENCVQGLTTISSFFVYTNEIVH